MGADGAFMETLLRSQQMREYVERGHMGEATDLEIKPPKKGTKHVAWILVRDCTAVSDGSGPIRFKAGYRVTDLAVKKMLEGAGAKLKPTAA
jgi:hypothetical protein